MANIEKIYDVVIIGGGPAGLSAAIYLTRAKYSVLILEKEQFGGQITITHEVVNYPGVGKCSGKDLTDTMYRQAEYFGAEFLIAEATGINLKDDVKTVYTNRGNFKCLGVLLATGASPKMVGFRGESEYRGRGVAYCATCDGEFFTGKEVFVIGGGFAAAEESVFLTKFASHVTMLIRGKDFSCAEAVAEQARNNEKITVIVNTVVEEVKGEAGLNYIRYKNCNTGEVTEYHAEEGDYFGVFVFAGYRPETLLVKDLVELDEQDYVITDNSQQSSAEGLYAAGDICIKPLRQVVTATSDGALAATELEKYVAKVQRKTGIRTQEPVIRDNTLFGKTENMRSDPTQSSGSMQSSGLFTPEMHAQLDTVFERMENPLVLKLYMDNRPVSKELQEYVEALTAMTDKLSMEIATDSMVTANMAKDNSEEYTPCVKIYKRGVYTGLAFHGVPGGHEFTSFVLGLYNAAGPGQAMDEELRKQIININNQVDIKILVSLSCTMCPDLVIAAQHIAAVGENITAEVYDIQHNESLKNKYNVMSVPCMVINDEQVHFGKKSMQQILEILGDKNISG